MKITALKHFIYDLFISGFQPPYTVIDRQSPVLGHEVSFFSMRKAIETADCDLTRRTKTGTVHPVGIGNQIFYFSIDGKGRKHLPRALRERIL